MPERPGDLRACTGLYKESTCSDSQYPDTGKLSPGYINLLQFQTGDRFSVPGFRIFVFAFGYETGSAKLCMRLGPGRSFQRRDDKLMIWRRFTITTVF